MSKFCTSGLFLFLLASVTVADVSFYVATNGNDAWSGKLPQPNSDKTDGPFATLDRAREASRAFLNKEDVKIEISPGTYRLNETLIITAEDSSM